MQRSRANEKGRDFSLTGRGFIELQVSGGEHLGCKNKSRDWLSGWIGVVFSGLGEGTK